MPTYIEVAVNIPGRIGTFDYHLPPELEGQVQSGCLVVVPFGRQRVQGVVAGFIEQASVPQTRPVEMLLDPQPVVTPAQMALARRMAHTTLSPLAACLDLMLPPGLSQQADSEYRLNPGLNPWVRKLTPTQQRIVGLLVERGSMRGRQYESALPRRNWKPALQTLVNQGVVLRTPLLPDPVVRPRMARVVSLAVAPAAVDDAMNQVGRAGTPAYQRRKAILEYLAREDEPVDVSWVYAASGGTSADLKRLANLGLVRFHETEVWRDPLAGIESSPGRPPALTTDQAEIWQRVREALQSLPTASQKPWLLHGVTGSGKTEIYLQAAAEIVRQGRQVIILVPEIALTPQTVRRFLSRFPGQVGLVHSQLSAGERYDTWRRARSGQLGVIVGPRSALFTPLPDLGLIVIDECHDPSYYQSEPMPAYHTIQTAIDYGRLAGALVLLGSATPDVSITYRANKEFWSILRLPLRIMAHREAVSHQLHQAGIEGFELAGEGDSAVLPLPPVEIVDMRQELKAGNRSIFSRSLTKGLGQVLERGQQAILYLNRLGSSTYVFCRSCGSSLRCPRCDRPLTYHSEGGRLVCHTCNYQRNMPARCPQCASPHIRQYGTGTEKVEQEVLQAFPGVRTLRWDSQTTRQKGAHDAILVEFAQRKADLLIGTQMLAKGLDLPLVTLVGVVLADVGLNLDDFRAAERTFQLLTQVAGRAGRSPLGGKVILQTFQPDHYAIQAAGGHDYQQFYNREIIERRRIGYPPFARLVRLEIRKPKAEDAEALARRMAAQVQGWIQAGSFSATDIIGPTPCFFPKLSGNFRWQVILRGPDPTAVLRGRELGDWRIEVDPQSLL